MALRKADPGDIKPCKHMETLVSSRVDDKLSGVAKVYTDWHISQCPRCQAGVQTLITLKRRLGELGSDGERSGDQGLAADKWSAVEEEWQNEDASRE